MKVRVTHIRRMRWLAIPLGILVVAVLAGVWFFYNFERKTVEIRRGLSPAARQNPFLAAEKYLAATGQPAFSEKGLDFLTRLPSVTDAIIIRHLPGGLSQSLTDGLWDWVAAGGRLLLVPGSRTSDHPGSDSLLKRLGVRVMTDAADGACDCPPGGAGEEPDEQAVTESAESAADEKWDWEHPYDAIDELTVDGNSIRLKVFASNLLEDESGSACYRLDGTYRIEYRNKADWGRDDHYQRVEQEGAWLLQYEVGQGKVTVFSEMALFSNTHIGDQDHAYFLSWLVGGADRVWLLYSSRADSLLTILMDKMPHFWISIIVLLLLWLLKQQKQSGTLLTTRRAGRQNVMEHLDAAARFHWRTDRLDSIVAANRRAIQQHWAARKHGLLRGQNGGTLDTAASMSAAGVSQVEFSAAFKQSIDHEQDIIQNSRALQKIWMRLQGGERN